MADGNKFFSVRVFGDKELLQKLDKVANFHSSESLKSILVDASNMLVLLARDKVPTRSYLLHSSIRAYQKDFGTKNPSIVFGAYVRYAGYVEEPTRPHVINPRVKRFLHWGTKGIRGERVSIPHGIIPPAGVVEIFRKGVYHPGTKAQPFFNPAIDRVQPRLVLAVKRALQDAMK